MMDSQENILEKGNQEVKVEETAVETTENNASPAEERKVYTTKKEVLDRVKEIAHGEEAPQKEEVEYLKTAFYKLHIAEREANLKACLAPSEYAGEVFNIAYGGREYLIDMYYGLTKALNVETEPVFGPERPGDIRHSNADISRARAELGYEPEWSFDRGIQAAIDWYRENL